MRREGTQCLAYIYGFDAGSLSNGRAFTSSDQGGSWQATAKACQVEGLSAAVLVGSANVSTTHGGRLSLCPKAPTAAVLWCS